MADRGYLIAGNWKMNGNLESATELSSAIVGGASNILETVELLLCPPAVHLQATAAAISGTNVRLGGQDCHEAESGAFTGDISAEMLANMNCSYVIVGHSERRDAHHEGDALVWRKANAALRAGLAPIICVGETEQERLSGNAEEVVAKQLKASVPDGVDGSRLSVAYEPVWAIGSGRTPTQEEILSVHSAMRKALKDLLGHDAGDSIRLLYGGSVKPGNAAEILTLSEVDGALVGGASLSASDFLSIALAVK